MICIHMFGASKETAGHAPMSAVLFSPMMGVNDGAIMHTGMAFVGLCTCKRCGSIRNERHDWRGVYARSALRRGTRGMTGKKGVSA